MLSPFEVGDRIFDIHKGYQANVTKLTDKGFKYQFDKMIPLIPRWGMSMMGGECFEGGFQFWELWNGKNKVRALG